MLTLSGCRRVSMQLLSDRLYTLRYHWRGRSVLCAGRETCLGCQIDRPRPVYYTVASVIIGDVAQGDKPRAVRGVVEICASARTIIEQCAAKYGEWAGTWVSMSRQSPKREWRCDASGYKEPGNSIDDGREVMLALATVLRVDDPAAGDSFEQWADRAAQMHCGLMRGTQLALG
jgi:hypothetical protein